MLKSENIQISNNQPDDERLQVAQASRTETSAYPEKGINTKNFNEELEYLAKNKNLEEVFEDSAFNKMHKADNGLEKWEELFSQDDLQAQWIAAFYGKTYEMQVNEPSTGKEESSCKTNMLDFLNSRRTSDPASSEPVIDLDKENFKMKVDFPMLSDLKSVTVQYDPTTRSIAAEMVTSREAAVALQNQVSELERNLAKHNIKLQSFKVMASSGNNYNQSKQQQSQKRNQG